jgi:hypothetical protein
MKIELICLRCGSDDIMKNGTPLMYRQCTKVYTDDWEADETVIPSQRHFAVGKESGLTN